MKKIIVFTIIFNLFSLKGFTLEKNVLLFSHKEKPLIGEEITLSLNIDSIKDIYGFEIELLYDNTTLLPLDSKVKEGELLKDKNYFLAVNRVSEGKIKVMGTLLGSKEKLEDKGTLFKFKMKPLKRASTEIKAKKLKVVDINGKSMDASLESSAINIEEKDNNSSHTKNRNKTQDISIQGPKEVLENLKIEKIDTYGMDKNLKSHSNIYKIIATEELNLPITIIINYKGQVDEEKLGIYYYNEDRKKWLYMGGKVDLQNSSIAVTINRLAKFGVFSHNKDVFNDLDDHWCKEFAKRLYLMDFIEGYQDGSFKPDKFMTRGEMAVVLSKTMDMDSGESKKFTDDHLFHPWTRKSIYAVARGGLFTGYEDGSFKSYKYITRAELMNVIGKLLPHKECDVIFKDAKEIPPWALKGIKNCTSHGIVQGYDGFIRPQGNITRGEASALIYNLLKVLKI